MVLEFERELETATAHSIHPNAKQAQDEIELYRKIYISLNESFGKVDLESVFTVVDAVAQGKTLRDLGYFATFRTKELESSLLLAVAKQEDRLSAQRLRTKFESYIRKVCWVKPDKLNRILSTYLAFFNEVFRVTGGPQSQYSHENTTYFYNQLWNFFTTNYDNVLEILWRSGIRQIALNTGFQYDQNSKSEIWNPQVVFQQNLRLVKLHGSVTWWREESTGRVVERDQPPDANYLPRKLGEQIILYPIQQKDAFLPPFFDMFYALRQALGETRKWIVVGYSFADEIIRGMFARASTPMTRLVLVHPDEEAAKSLRAETGWSGDIRHIKTKFGQPETNIAVREALS